MPDAITTPTPDPATTPDLETADLRLRLAETEQRLAQARQALDAAQRRHALERELWMQGALDIDTAATLAEAALTPDADVRAAVADLKRRTPFLFRATPAPSAMAAHPAPASDLDRAAAEARQSGDRRALLRYLRLRRTG